LVETKLHGSGGYIIAEISEELQKKADLGVGKLFLAPVGKLNEKNMKKYFCKECNNEFNFPPKIILEEKNREEVADNLILVERGQYNCGKCDTVIGEYRVFEKQDDSAEVGKAKSDNN
jgi:hypothetical protein